MQNIDSYRPRSVASAFVSFEAIIAILFCWLFWFTVTNVDTEIKKSDKVGNKPNPDTPAIMQAANGMKPMVLAKAGKFEDAQAAANELLKTKKLDVASNIAAGNTFVMCGIKDDGIRLLHRAVALAPQNRYVRLNYADRLNEVGEKDLALSEYQMLAKVYPSWKEPHQALAKIYMADERYADAAQELGAILNVDENNSEVLKTRGIALARSGPGEVSAGLDQYMMGLAIENHAGLPEKLKNLVNNWGTVDRAVYELQQQINERPDDYVPKLLLAQLYSYMGQAHDAEGLLSDARRIAPNNFEIHRELGIVKKKLGENNQAISEFSLSIQLELAKQKQEKQRQQQQEQQTPQ